MFCTLNISTFAAVINLNSSMYSSSDFEHLFIHYKSLGRVPLVFLFTQVPYNLFHKWYKDTCHQLVPAQVESHQESAPLKIMIDIRMSTGIHIW